MSGEKKVTKDIGKEKAVRPVAYIGPSIQGVVSKNTVLNNGLTKVLEEKCKEIPAIRSMIVPVEKLAYARMDADIKGSNINICYEEVLKKIR